MTEIERVKAKITEYDNTAQQTFVANQRALGAAAAMRDELARLEKLQTQPEPAVTAEAQN